MTAGDPTEADAPWSSAVNTRPKEPPTGARHPDCYARGLRDCGATDRNHAPGESIMDKEHYISEKLLKRIHDRPLMEGLSFLNDFLQK